jgi:hypothetical protein
MPRGPTTFRQRDLAAALKAAAAAGAQVARVEVDRDGRIILILIGKKQPDNNAETNEWDNAT